MSQNMHYVQHINQIQPPLLHSNVFLTCKAKFIVKHQLVLWIQKWLRIKHWKNIDGITSQNPYSSSPWNENLHSNKSFSHCQQNHTEESLIYHLEGCPVKRSTRDNKEWVRILRSLTCTKKDQQTKKTQNDQW